MGKARQQLRDKASAWFSASSPKFGAADEAHVTDYQRGMVQGLYEWRVWSLEEREAELQSRLQIPSETAVEEAPVPETPQKKKASKIAKAQGGEEEDLDSLLAEFGVTVEEKKKKTRKRK